MLILQKYTTSKTKDSGTKDYALCLGNISKEFKWKIWKEKAGLKGNVNFFSVGFNSMQFNSVGLNDTNNILGIHKYSTKKAWYNIMFGLIKKIFIALLTDHTSLCEPIKNV